MSFESVNKIKSLQQGIETVTGESYGDLTTAVQALKDGYGSSSVVASGDCGENVVWTLYDTGELIISGTGAMYDYTEAGSSPIYEYLSNVKRVVIEDGVTTIESFFFCECEEITSVIIPDSVTFISHGAFLYCPKLTNITIGKGVTTIDKNVFSTCRNLSSVTIHKGVVSIGERAFVECVKLTDVYYEGTKSEWENIAIGDANDCLLNATLHCEYEESSSSGSGIIEVTKLPTEDIDESAIYKVLNDGRIAYLLNSSGDYTTLEDVLLASITKEVEFHFVDELPDEMLKSNYDIVHAYVVSTGVVYAYITGEGVFSCSQIFGYPDKGYTDDISLETEEGVYVQRGEPTIDWYIRENGEWKMISPDAQTKEVTYTESGEYEITPDDGKVLSKATVKVEVPERYDEGYGDGKADGYAEGYTASQNARQEKTFVENGEYTPDEGCSGFSKVTVNVTNTDTVDGWHVDVRSDGSDPPSGTINTITFVYGG